MVTTNVGELVIPVSRCMRGGRRGAQVKGEYEPKSRPVLPLCFDPICSGLIAVIK
jgi:hypothetical protein